MARVYRWAEYLALGPLLHRTRLTFLGQVQGAAQAVVLGDGDGRFTAALLRRAPSLHLQAVDTSSRMLHLLANRCTRDGNAGRLQIMQASALQIELPSACDLIVTHFFLDCLTQTEVDALAARFGSQANPGCRWLVSEFGLPRSRLVRPLARVYLRLLYLAFRVLTGLRTQHLPDPQSALRSAGFRCLERRERLGGFLYSELWERTGERNGRAE